MLDIITFPMGYILRLIYDNIAFNSYGIAIIMFTIFVKSLLLPLYIKQSQSTVKIGKLQPQLQIIQNKYKKEPDKLNQEVMKLYKENNVNPAGAMFPLIIQMPILFSLYFVISQPLKYMMNKSPEVIEKLFQLIPDGVNTVSTMRDISIINYFSENPEKIANIGNLISKNDLLNMNFMGINLGVVPTWNYHELFSNSVGSSDLILLLIPIFAAFTTYLSVYFSMKQTMKGNESSAGNQSINSMNKMMLLISPIMTGMISFSVPCGMGLYWITGNLYQIFQQMITNYVNSDKNKYSKSVQNLKE